MYTHLLLDYFIIFDVKSHKSIQKYHIRYELVLSRLSFGMIYLERNSCAQCTDLVIKAMP